MNGLKGFYSQKVDTLSSEISELKRRNRIYVILELVTFISAVSVFVFYCMRGQSSASLFVAVAFLALYIGVRRADMRNGEKTDRLIRKRRVYEKELKYLAGDFSCFDDGGRYSDPLHAFSFDMDVFGRDSLFNRIDRTVTTGGSDILARSLSSLLPDKEQVEARREAVEELKEKEEWRTGFLSAGIVGLANGETGDEKIDTAEILDVTDKVRNMRIAPFAGRLWAYVAAWVVIAGFMFTVIGSVAGMFPADVPVMWGTVQLFAVLAITSKSIRNISRAVGCLHAQLHAYCILTDRIYGAEFKARELKTITDSLFSQRDSSLKAFGELSDILKRLDRRANVLGLILFNVAGLSDFFLVRKFIVWHKLYMDMMPLWVDCVSRMDALVSMAVFCYNEPETSVADVVDADGVVYDACGLYHPFLGNRAVRNDFSVKDGNYYIITGANMAGKSTFLRSVGINYILAMNGLPVFADSLRVSAFNLFSSMRTTDDLTRGISYFNAELLRLRQLIDCCGQARRTLIILDEILKGTNSLDKLNGSRLFLRKISLLPVTGIIATHDLELSKMEDDARERFHNFCFEIELADNITYTYKITPGVARNQNATYLLKRILEDIGSDTVAMPDEGA